MIKTKIFQSGYIDRLNKEIDDFVESQNANVVDVKLAINPGHKPSYSEFVVVLIYSV